MKAIIDAEVIIPETLSEQVLAAQPESVRCYILSLETKIQLLSIQVDVLTAQVNELLARLAKNSSNSGRPPSSDGLNKSDKTKSQREPSGKKPGGQIGRQGKTLNQIENPDHIICHSPATCKDCGHSLLEVQGMSVEAR